jgi:hypothetical protein
MVAVASAPAPKRSTEEVDEVAILDVDEPSPSEAASRVVLMTVEVLDDRVPISTFGLGGTWASAEGR